MFERYTDRARRVLFFARFEAGQLGAAEIHPEHLLLGIIKEGHGLTSRLFARHRVSLEDLRQRIEGRVIRHEPRPDAVEVPFSAATRRALDEAARAVDRGARNALEVSDLLIGLGRAGDPLAAATLAEVGLTPDLLEAEVGRLLDADRATQDALAVSLELASGADAAMALLRQEVAELRARVERLERQARRPDVS